MTEGFSLPAALGQVPEAVDLKAAILALADRPKLAVMLCRRLQLVPRHQREAQFPSIIRAIAESLP